MFYLVIGYVSLFFQGLIITLLFNPQFVKLS